MSKFDFNPKDYQKKLLPLIKALKSNKTYDRVLRCFPKTTTTLFTKAEIISGLRYFGYPINLVAKPVRTSSGVVPVTVLTKPYPCPGTCIFCPLDANLPKSYLSSEPGAQRALANRFDPFNQVITRLNSYYANGHNTDKVELIVLGGTWSFYPLSYQIWFINRCFQALNAFQSGQTLTLPKFQTTGQAAWIQLKKSQLQNQTAATRCVGLSLETRPDFISQPEVIRLRKLGCTKVQLGVQSLDNKILRLNRRGHTIQATRQAFRLLRLSGFKIQAHWMANLYGSSVKKDIADFKKIFSQSYYRPDELKIYPCSLIASAQLFNYYQKGLYRPYTQNQLLSVLSTILPLIPAYCRVTRMIRDFSSADIVSGNKASNFRQLVESAVLKAGQTIQEIRFREIRRQPIDFKQLKLKVINYKTSTGREKFLQFVTSTNHLVAFLRLSLPQTRPFIKELQASAIIREIHVYGQALNLGESAKTQHLGLGTRLIQQAVLIARKLKFKQLSVISSIGTKPYYRRYGFKQGLLYQHQRL